MLVPEKIKQGRLHDPASSFHCLLEQSFGLHRRDHRWPTGNPRTVGLKIGELGKIKADVFGPIGYRKQIAVGNRKGVTHQKLFAGEFAIQPGKAFLELIQAAGLRLDRGRRIEQRAKGLVDFGTDKGQPFLKFVSLEGSIGRRQMFSRNLICNLLDNRRPFAQTATVVEFQNWNVAQRVDGVEVSTIRQ